MSGATQTTENHWRNIRTLNTLLIELEIGRAIILSKPKTDCVLAVTNRSLKRSTVTHFSLFLSSLGHLLAGHNGKLSADRVSVALIVCIARSSGLFKQKCQWWKRQQASTWLRNGRRRVTGHTVEGWENEWSYLVRCCGFVNNHLNRMLKLY